MNHPRLNQPLFKSKEQLMLKTELASTLSAAHVVRAYDVIWNLVYRPDDISQGDRYGNAKIMLSILGDWIDCKAGEPAFECSPRQLSFPDTILSPIQPAQPESAELFPLGGKLE